MLLQNIKRFIDARVREHPQVEPWLADWEPGLETQINVDPTNLEPCDFKGDKPTSWLTPDGFRIGHIRIPRNANTTEPYFRDRRPIGDEHRYWSLIGTTGWHWEQKKSHWVGFDFDSMNHKSGLPSEQLKEILERSVALPYVTARTSKSALGIHLIVRLDPQPTTRTHTEHSQLAKHVLQIMERDTGYEFRQSADVCGLVLWHWQRGLVDGGLQQIECGRLGAATTPETDSQ
jgi:hypothetical protein